ncbi:MAG TPA: ABC transporter permease [Acetobacteraceae bacterium]|nr:ABC transporter permease [Acetobacteraceae bacterium]
MSFRQRSTRFLMLREASIVIVAVLLFIYFAVANSNFISGDNLQTLSQFIAPSAIIACGEIMLLICGEIDLSVGQVFALAPFIMAYTAHAGLTLGVGIIFALIASAIVGLINGLITIMLKVPSFVTTLGTLFLINGFTLTISGGFPINTPGGPTVAAIFGAGYHEFLWALLIVLIMHVVLRHRRWGMHTIAVGGNLTGATEAGINAARIKVGNFMLTSVLGGITGILEAFRIGSTDPLAGGTNIMFLAVASGVIGGTSLAGGSGTIIGGLIGAAVLGILQDGFTLQGINAFTFDMIIGAAILIAMVANIYFGQMRSYRPR